MADQAPLRRVVTPATRLLAICGKCGRKLGGGFGTDGGQTLGKTLRRQVVGARGKRAMVRIVETKCLDICPKGAVVLVDSAEPGAAMIVVEGTPMVAIAGALRLKLIE